LLLDVEASFLCFEPWKGRWLLRVGDPSGKSAKLPYKGTIVSYHVTHWTGEMDSGFPIAHFGDLFDELSKADDEHSDVSVSHESEWVLTVYKSSFVVLENLEEGDPMHMGPVDRSAALELMVAMAEGRIDEVKSKPWLTGYPPGGRGG
jgi:hypothetical protein